MKAMILAAGYGRRLRPLTDRLPKPLVPVNGKPLIQYHIEGLASAGVRDLVINTAWLGEQVESYLGSGSSLGVSISWSREKQPLETGGGIFRALPLLGEDPFIVVSSDVWSDFSYSQLATFSLPRQCEAHLVLVPNPEYHDSGDYSFLDKGSEEEGLLTAPYRSGHSYTFSGIGVMRPELIRRFVQSQPDIGSVFPLREVFSAGIGRRVVCGEIFRGRWCDVGTAQRLEQLERTIAGG